MRPELSSQNHFDTAAIRQLLTSGFNDEELTYFCYDHFRTVHQEFTEGMTFSRKVQLLIDYCDRTSGFGQLLALVQEANPVKYQEFGPYGPNSQEPPTGGEVPADAPPQFDYLALRVPPAGAEELAGGPNPFGDRGCITDPDRFFDREELLRQIFEELNKGVNLSLVGESQIGKSSLLWMVSALGVERLDPAPDTITYLSLEWVDNEDDFYEALSDVLGLPEPLRGYRLKRALTGRRIVLCLDEMEKMAWGGFTVYVRSQLRGLADGAEAPLNLVIASRSPLAHLFPDSPALGSPLAGICRQLDVGPFPADVARAFLLQRLEGSGVTFTEAQIEAILAAANGHPGRLQQAAAELYRRLVAGSPA